MPTVILEGPQRRVGTLLHIFNYLPPMTMTDMYGVTMPVCGRCFKKLGDDPFNGREGAFRTGCVKGAICGFCGHRADPFGV